MARDDQQSSLYFKVDLDALEELYHLVGRTSGAISNSARLDIQNRLVAAVPALEDRVKPRCAFCRQVLP